jgi:hypothetical protein
MEHEPFLVPELQRQFAAEPVAVHSHRSTVDIRSASKVDLLVIRCRGGDDDLACLCMARNEQPEIVIVLVVPESALDLEWALRDLGADAVLEDTCGGARLADICRRGMPTTNC